jgi:hypothetical protein
MVLEKMAKMDRKGAAETFQPGEMEGVVVAKSEGRKP